MKKYKKLFNEESYYYWLGISLDSQKNKKMDLVGSVNEKQSDKIANAFSNASNVTIFSIDNYGKSNIDEVKEYFKKYEIIEILYYKNDNPINFIKKVYKDLKG